MKFTSKTVAVVAALVPLVATFAPGFTRHRPALDLQAVAAGDVPDIVQAYKKVKQVEPKLPDLPTPVVTEPVQAQSVQPVVVSPPESSFSMPDIKIELPSAPEISAADFQSSVSDSIETAKKAIPNINMKGTADQINAQFKGINDFFKASQEQAARAAAERGDGGSGGTVPTLGEMIERGLISRRASFTETSGISVPEGKAPTLAEYVLGGFQSPTGGASAEALAESKAKFALLVDNTYSLFGKSAPENFEMNLPEGMSPETAATIAVAGFGLLVIAGQNSKSSPTPSPAVTVEDKEEVGGLSKISKDVKAMAEQIKLLSQETKDLRSQLKEAREKINQKELDISKEKFKTADGELKLKRELEKVSVQLRESEARNKVLQKELEANADVQARIKVLEDQLKASGITAPKPAPAPKPAVEAPKPAPAPKAVVEAPKPAPAPAVEEKKTPTPKKGTGPKGSAAKAASPQASKSPAPKAKKAAKAKAKAKKAEPATSSDDWSSLSASALSRKTVKDLTDYLSEKGVETNGEDGNPLKKALLVEAVRSL